MKRKVLLFLCIAAFLLTLTGCSRSSWNAAVLLSGVEISGESAVIAENCRVIHRSTICHAISGSLYNPLYTEAIVQIGTPSLEVLVNDKWYKVPSKSTLPEAWDCPVEKRTAMNFVLNLDELYDFLPNGIYRYVFTLESDGQTYLVPAEFEMKQPK
jgi:hypothetical protein